VLAACWFWLNSPNLSFTFWGAWINVRNQPRLTQATFGLFELIIIFNTQYLCSLGFQKCPLQCTRANFGYFWGPIFNFQSFFGHFVLNLLGIKNYHPKVFHFCSQKPLWWTSNTFFSSCYGDSKFFTLFIFWTRGHTRPNMLSSKIHIVVNIQRKFVPSFELACPFLVLCIKNSGPPKKIFLEF